MSWLERLKNLEAAETVLPELTEAPSVSFVSAVSAPVEDCAPPSVSFVSAESGDADFSAGSAVTEDSPELATVADVIARHGERLLDRVRVADVLALADDGDLSDFLADRAALEAFAVALVADRRIRPLPDASLPPLERLAQEIGDDPAELRRWLNLSAQGRRIRQRIESEAAAIERCLLGLRADPDTGLHAVLVRVLEGHQGDERTRKPQDDERVQNRFGAWRTPAEHERIAAYDRHHWTCTTCIRAGRGYGARCEAGERLHAATRAG